MGSRIVKLETIFEKSHRSSVILKIVGATPQLVQNLTPIRKLFCTFLYQCCYSPIHLPSHIRKQKNLKDQKWITFFTQVNLPWNSFGKSCGFHPLYLLCPKQVNLHGNSFGKSYGFHPLYLFCPKKVNINGNSFGKSYGFLPLYLFCPKQVTLHGNSFGKS